MFNLPMLICVFLVIFTKFSFYFFIWKGDTFLATVFYHLFWYSMGNMFWCQYRRSQHYAMTKAIERILKKTEGNLTNKTFGVVVCLMISFYFIVVKINVYISVCHFFFKKNPPFPMSVSAWPIILGWTDSCFIFFLIKICSDQLWSWLSLITSSHIMTVY
jgi:hypothetical protein